MGKIYCLIGKFTNEKYIIEKNMLSCGLKSLELNEKIHSNIDLENNNYICNIELITYMKMLKKLQKKNVVGIYILNNNESLFEDQVSNCYEINNKIDYIIENTNTSDSIKFIFKQIGLNYSLSEIPILPLATKVKIRKINNLSKASHLKKFINKYGYILNNHVIWKNKRRYKVLFIFEGYEETAYFRYDELTVISF